MGWLRPADSSQVAVNAWETPRSGWLYVVDPDFNDESRIWLFDPDLGRVMGTIRAGYDPDIAVSPRGDRLYVASTLFGCGRRNCDELTVIDTDRGTVLGSAAIPERMQYTLYPESSRMAMSEDGRAVYVLKSPGVPSGDSAVSLAVFDTELEQFLPEEIDLGECGYGSFVSTPTRKQLAFHCPASNELRLYRLLSSSKAVVEAAVAVPWGQRLFAGHTYSDVPAAEFVRCSNRNDICAVGGDGTVYAVDLKARIVTRTAISGGQDETVSPLDWPPSAPRTRLYVAAGPYDDAGGSDEIRVFDSETWQQLNTIRTSTPFWNAVASRDGSMIYALTREHGSVLAIDTAKARELRAVPLGRAPSLALVAP